MSQLKFNQTELYEILIKEIASLKKASKEFNKLYSQVEKHLQRLEARQKQYPHSPISTNLKSTQSSLEG